MRKRITKTELRRLRAEKRTNRIFLIAGILFVFLGLWSVYQRYFHNDLMKSIQIHHYEQQVLPLGKICMYSDRFLAKTATVVYIGEDRWYVCCKKCKRGLKLNFKNSQFAEDPLTHEHIKKSEAFAYLANSLNDRVLYFKSNENHDKWINQKAK